MTADMAIITSKKGRVPCADQAKVKKHARSGEVKGADERVIIIGGGSGGAGAVEGLREVSTLVCTPPNPTFILPDSACLLTNSSVTKARSPCS